MTKLLRLLCLISLSCSASADIVVTGTITDDDDSGTFPDETTTGWEPTGVTLTNHGSSCTLSTNSATYDSVRFNCDLTITGTNITITRSEINGTISNGFGSAQGLVLEDVEINGGNTTFACVGSDGFTIRRANIYGCGQGVHARNFTLEDSYIHDLYGEAAIHGEAVLGWDGDIVVTGNQLEGDFGAVGTWDPGDGGMSSSVSFYTHGEFWGPIDNLVFDGNFLKVGDGAGGHRDYANYCLYVGGSETTNASYTNNVFDRNVNDTSACGASGTYTDLPPNDGTNCWSNNRFADGTAITAGLPACP